MNKFNRRSVAEEAARLMVEGFESEYLHAKELAILKLGMSGQTRLPSNRKVRECIGRITQYQLGEDEVKRRIRAMRLIALRIMSIIEDYDPFLIGSTLSGEIRGGSDIDLHAYGDDFQILKEQLQLFGYEDVQEEFVENLKGSFCHLTWSEQGFPVEITLYPWSWREVIPISSVTGKPMKRADLHAVKKLVAEN